MKRFFLLLAAMRLGFFTEGRYSHWSSLPSAASQVSSAVFSTSRGAWKRTRILSRSFGPLSTQRVTRRSLVAPDLLTSRSTCRSSSSRTCCSSRWRFMISRPDCAAAGIAPAARSTIERRATTAPGDVTRPPAEQIAEHGEEAIVVPPAAPESVGLSRQEVQLGLDVQRVGDPAGALELDVVARRAAELGDAAELEHGVLAELGLDTADHRLAEGVVRQPRPDERHAVAVQDVGVPMVAQHRLTRVLDDEEHLVEPGVADVQRVVESRDPLEAVGAAVGLHDPCHRRGVSLELAAR